MKNNDQLIQIEMLQDGSTELDAEAVCTCDGGGTSCCSCLA